MGDLQVRNITEEQAYNLYPGPSDYVHLHSHTIYSLLDGVAKPEDYFIKCVERKWPAVAITEHGVLNSLPDGYFASKKFGIKFIAGVEAYMNDYEPYRQKINREGGKIADVKATNVDLASRISRNRHLTVLCKNEVGYSNLLKINRVAWEDGFYYKPRVWFDLLAKYHEGLIILSGCLNGPVCHELRNGNFASKDYITGAVDYVKKFKEVFKDDYYIELQMPGIDGDRKLFKQLIDIADRFKLKTILSNDAHYVQRKDYAIQKIMMAIDQQTTVDDPNLWHVNSDEQFFKTRYELRATFMLNGYVDLVPISVFESSCDNTLEVADKCKSFKPDTSPKLPKIKDADRELCLLALRGLKERGIDKDETRFLMDGREVTYREQMQIELGRFIEKGFSSYFLITRDLIQESLRHGLPLGPCRGSSGGSLVCYLIGITALNPMLWGTSFDRFLSPSRGGNMLKISMD